MALTLLVTPLVIIYSWNHFPEPHNPKAFLILILVLHTGMLGTFVAQDLILFFVFFEVVLLPMYFMIGVWGGEQRQYASIKFFLYTLFGSALMIVSFVAVFFVAGGESFSMADDRRGRRRAERGRHPGAEHAGPHLRRHVHGLRHQGADVPVPHVAARRPHPGAHPGLGDPGRRPAEARHLRLHPGRPLRSCPEAAVEWAPFIGGLAVVGIIYGALGCLAQTDMKRLIAFSSVAHMGFVMLGIATLTDFGLNAAVFGMVAHGLITGMLFFIAGSVKERFHTLEIKRLGGLLLQAPRMGWILGFCVMASLGLPGLAGFWGEFPAILSAYNPAPALSEELFRTYMVIAAIGTVLAAGYLLWLYQRIVVRHAHGGVRRRAHPRRARSASTSPGSRCSC